MGGRERERKRSFGRACSSLEQTTPPAELHSQQHMREHSAELASSPGSNTCDCNSCESGNNVRVAVWSLVQLWLQLLWTCIWIPFSLLLVLYSLVFAHLLLYLLSM